MEERGKLFQKNDHTVLEITDLSDKGEGIGKADGFVLFVKDTVPGDVAEVVITKVKKHYGYARMLRVIRPSDNRVEAPCPAAKQCGGCSLQAMRYEEQLRCKERIVKNALERIGGFTVDAWQEATHADPAGGQDKDVCERVFLDSIIPSDPPLRYRNKAVIPVGTDREGKVIAGFYAGRTHRIVSCDDCLLGPEENSTILREILCWMKDNGIDAYDEDAGNGLIRHIFLRMSRESGSFQLCLIVNGYDVPASEDLRKRLDRLHSPSGSPLIQGACFSANTARTNVIFGDPARTLWGDPVIYDRLCSDKFGISVRYAVSPESFFQVNPRIAEKMYEQVLELACLTGQETVFDLYCGAGTISLFLAKKALRVVGIEVVPEAVRNAQENAERNGIENAEFLEGRAEDMLPAFLAREQITADVIVVDPPRKGCEDSLLETILQVQPKKVIYVSCNPSTLARDMKFLCAGGYHAAYARPYDQFVMSMHVETVVLMTRT